MDKSYNSKPEFQDESTREYFESLPTSVQETIIQSGVEIKSKEHLQELADNYSQNNQNS